MDEGDFSIPIGALQHAEHLAPGFTEQKIGCQLGITMCSLGFNVDASGILHLLQKLQTMLIAVSGSQSMDCLTASTETCGCREIGVQSVAYFNGVVP